MRRTLPFVLFALAAVTALWLSAEQDRGRPAAARENAERNADVAAGPSSWPPPTGIEIEPPKRDARRAVAAQPDASAAAASPTTASPTAASEARGVEDVPPPRIGDSFPRAGGESFPRTGGESDAQQVAVGGSGKSAPPIPVIAGAPPVPAPAPAPVSDPAPAPRDETPPARIPEGDNPPPDSVVIGELPPEVQEPEQQRRADNESFARGLVGGP